MLRGKSGLRKLAFALFSVAIGASARAAEPVGESLPSGPKAKIEFSRPTKKNSAVPNPASRYMEDLQDRLGIGPQVGNNSGEEVRPDFTPSTGVTMPSRVTQEKWLDFMDKKKNWLFPGAANNDENSMDAFGKQSMSSKDFSWDKTKRPGMLEQFVMGTKDKEKTPEQLRKDSQRERREAEEFEDGRDRFGKDGDRRDGSIDPNEGSDLADFNLKAFINPDANRQNDLRKEDNTPRAFQSFRAEIANRRDDRERVQDREREAARTAEFQKLIQPRGGGGQALGAIPDPINAPDLTRRDLVPIMPRGGESTLSRSAFGPPPSSSLPRFQDNSMFGSAAPSAAGITPSFTPPPSSISTVNPQTAPLILEPPKRRFN